MKLRSKVMIKKTLSNSRSLTGREKEVRTSNDLLEMAPEWTMDLVMNWHSSLGLHA